MLFEWPITSTSASGEFAYTSLTLGSVIASKWYLQPTWAITSKRLKYLDVSGDGCASAAVYAPRKTELASVQRVFTYGPESPPIIPWHAAAILLALDSTPNENVWIQVA